MWLAESADAKPMDTKGQLYWNTLRFACGAHERRQVHVRVKFKGNERQTQVKAGEHRVEEDRVCQAGPHLSPTAMLLISCMTILSLKFLTCKIKLPTSKIVMEYGKLNKDLFLLNPFLLSSQPTELHWFWYIWYIEKRKTKTFTDSHW